MTISSMIQPEKKVHFFQIIEFSVYRFYVLLKEGRGNIGDGRQCFKLKGRGVNLYSKRDFLEYNDIEEGFFDELCHELWIVSNKTPNWDIDRLFAYKNEITENVHNIMEAKTLNDLELYISDSKTANFIFTFLMHFSNTSLNVNHGETPEPTEKEIEKVVHETIEPDSSFHVEILNRFQVLENRVKSLETENKRLETQEKDYIDKIHQLESELKRIDKIDETLEMIHIARKKSLQEISDNTDQKFSDLIEKINGLKENSFNKESIREFLVKLENMETQISDIKSEFVKEDALQTFTMQLEKLNKEVNHISDEHGNELKKIELRFTKIKGERLELRDKMELIEEVTKENFEKIESKLSDEVEQIGKIADEMTHRQQELQTLLQSQIVENKGHVDQTFENLATIIDEVKEKQHDAWIKINELIGKSKDSQGSGSSDSNTKMVIEPTKVESDSSIKYIDVFYAEPDGNGFLTNLSSKKLSYKHVYKINVIDDATADFEFVNDDESTRTLNMNLAVMFDEYMVDNGTKGPSMSLSLYGEAKKVRGLNAWRVSKKAMITRR
ncbi:coiled-coil domain-containing protein [Flammeovirga agarivorans]|uniref:Uncharacterized protein n=1 Tax=Flammeovirga agarivorans TaxID=2726742 RepID=A0A7X8SLS8_9BACT|nr:hypothetical protein [Flammeovirga agarivorans]NLR92574.1 hypothetical protein [Flammeovirga agarivorans]